MKMFDNIQKLIFDNLQIEKLIKYLILNKHLLELKLERAKKLVITKPLFNKKQIIGSSYKMGSLIQLDYKTIATASEETINLWDIYRHESTFTLDEHKKQITSLLYFNKKLISSSQDLTLIVWDLAKNPETDFKVIKTDYILYTLSQINKKTFLAISYYAILIFNQNYEVIKNITSSHPKFILPAYNYLILQRFDDYLNVLNIDDNFAPCKLTECRITTVCLPVLLDEKTIVVTNNTCQLVLYDIHNPKEKKIITKRYKNFSFIIKLKDNKFAAFTMPSTAEIFQFKQDLVTLVSTTVDKFIFSCYFRPMQDDGRVIVRANEYSSGKKTIEKSDLRIIDLETCESICLEKLGLTNNTFLQLKDKSIVSIIDGKTIVKWS
jgi:WD40 repeat protein